MTSSVITFPTNIDVVDFTWGQLRNAIEARSTFGAQAVESSVPLWQVKFTVAPSNDDVAGSTSSLMKSILMKLKGRFNRLALWDIGRPAPLGTMRGTMVLNLAATQGDVTLEIYAAGEFAKTLLAGDMIGIGQSDTAGNLRQVVIVTDDAMSDTDGIITVNIEPPLRNGFAQNYSVAWDKPTALFRRADSISSWTYKGGKIVDGATVNLIEDTRQ